MRHILLILIILLAPTSSANAASGEQVKTFLQTVGCSRLPTGACDALSAVNAKNLLIAYQVQLAQSYCGSGNHSSAKALLEMGEAHDASKCSSLLSVWVN